MIEGISAVLVFAVGVAMSPVPIIAVILMLFSRRARVNGPLFLLGWILALAVVGGVAYVVADQAGASTSATTADTISWGRVVLGLGLVGLGVRTFRNRPSPGGEAPVPRWMSGIDTMRPGRALLLGLVLAGVNPKNLILTIGAATAVAELGLAGAEVFGSLAVFVVVASVTIAGPVTYYLVGGAKAAEALGSLETWLAVHNAAVMTVLLVVIGVDLVATGLAVA